MDSFLNDSLNGDSPTRNALIGKRRNTAAIHSHNRIHGFSSQQMNLVELPPFQTLPEVIAHSPVLSSFCESVENEPTPSQSGRKSLKNKSLITSKKLRWGNWNMFSSRSTVVVNATTSKSKEKLNVTASRAPVQATIIMRELESNSTVVTPVRALTETKVRGQKAKSTIDLRKWTQILTDEIMNLQTIVRNSLFERAIETREAPPIPPPKDDDHDASMKDDSRIDTEQLEIIENDNQSLPQFDFLTFDNNSFDDVSLLGVSAGNGTPPSGSHVEISSPVDSGYSSAQSPLQNKTSRRFTRPDESNNNLPASRNYRRYLRVINAQLVDERTSYYSQVSLNDLISEYT